MWPQGRLGATVTSRCTCQGLAAHLGGRHAGLQPNPGVEEIVPAGPSTAGFRRVWQPQLSFSLDSHLPGGRDHGVSSVCPTEVSIVGGGMGR